MYDNYSASSILSGIAAISGAITIILLIILVISLVSQWKIYKKAGKKGWECLIPIYNIIVLLQIVELPTWYIILSLLPIVNIYAIFKIYIELAHKFGKSTGFGVATVFFNIICLPILAFGKNNVYKGENNISNQNVINQNNLTNPEPNNLNTQNNNNSDIQKPISFNQNINTEIKPINPVPQQVNNTISSIGNNLNQNPELQNNQQTQGLNVIPNATTIPQPIENNIVNNSNNQTNLNQPVSSSFEYNPPSSNIQPEAPQTNQVEQTIPTPVINTNAQLNVIPNLGTTPQPVDNNSVNNLNNEFGLEQPKITPFEYIAPSMSQNVPQNPPKNETLNPGLASQNLPPTQGLNVIPNMGVTQQSQLPEQNSGNNQNM